MDEKLRAPDGWLTLIGLFWLAPGPNAIGADPASAIVLPAGKAPERAGQIDFDGLVATLRPLPGVPLTVNGQPAAEGPLRSDADAPPDVVGLGDIALHVIKRGERYGVRVRDGEHPARRLFGGRQWFAIQPEYCVPATFVAYDPPRPRPITNILGDTNDELCPGYVRFELGGQQLELEASALPGGELEFVFRDGTSGKTTYPASRFLVAPQPRDGQTVLDFNKAYSPPCAFTDFATCPLPRPQNRLALAIAAGERYAPAEEHL